MTDGTVQSWMYLARAWAAHVYPTGRYSPQGFWWISLGIPNQLWCEWVVRALRAGQSIQIHVGLYTTWPSPCGQPNSTNTSGCWILSRCFYSLESPGRLFTTGWRHLFPLSHEGCSEVGPRSVSLQACVCGWRRPFTHKNTVYFVVLVSLNFYASPPWWVFSA